MNLLAARRAFETLHACFHLSDGCGLGLDGRDLSLKGRDQKYVVGPKMLLKLGWIGLHEGSSPAEVLVMLLFTFLVRIRPLQMLDIFHKNQKFAFERFPDLIAI